MKKKKKKNIWLILLFPLLVAIVLVIAVLTAIQKNNAGPESYGKMEKATLPLINLSIGNDRYVTLHGYLSEMTLSTMRDTIVPLQEGRKLFVKTELFENEIKGINYQVRSLSGEEYIDTGKIANPVISNGTSEFEISFSSLLENGKEYQLILEFEIKQGDAQESETKTVRYYSRIISVQTNYLNDLMSFAEEFSDAVYDREKAAKFIVSYLDPKDDSDTTDYSYADLNSKYSMITFGNSDVKKVSSMKTSLTEFTSTQAAFNFSYKMRFLTEQGSVFCNVTEYYCVRYRSGKVYLLDWHRELSQVFDAYNSTGESGRIFLGIGAKDTEIYVSPGKVYTAYIVGNEIREYNGKTNSMNLIFSFSDSEDNSLRSSYNRHRVQIVNVTDEGSVDYMVYGYMNRGTYEGMVGICFYRYDLLTNSTRRLFFMPVTQSEQFLMNDLGTLAYVNDRDVCYLRYGDGIYSIDLNSGENVEVTISAYTGMYAMNEKGNVVAWQEGDNLNYPERLVILNMDTQTTFIINAPEGEYVRILDFIGNDILYGFGSSEDSVKEANTETYKLLRRLCISSTDESKTIYREYTADGFFISNAYTDGTRIVIKRLEKEDVNTVKELEDDVLLLTQDISESLGKSLLKSRSNEELKKEYYIQLDYFISGDFQFSSTEPRYELIKKANEIKLIHRQAGAYYVYGYGRLLYVESEVSKAIREAYKAFGVVVDSSLSFIWTRNTRDLVKTLSYKETPAGEGSTSLSSALNILCASKGIQLSESDNMLEEGYTPFEIIDSAFKTGSSIKLYGCLLQEVLYFVNLGRPVIAVMGDREALVIVGYDLNGVSVYFPDENALKKLSTSEATQLFLKNDNAFISYTE